MRQGLSVIELLIGGIIIAIFALAIGDGCVTTSDRQASAERNAKNFASAMGWQIAGVVCSGADTPTGKNGPDGYVSCTLALASPSGDVAVVAAPLTRSIQCGYDKRFALMGQNTSCKEANPLTIQAQ